MSSFVPCNTRSDKKFSENKKQGNWGNSGSPVFRNRIGFLFCVIHPVEFTAGQQERSYAVYIGCICSYGFGCGTDGLDVSQFAIAMDAGNE